jgi:nitroimidazol reductase NimA-like FMN-containing flavoprotein (pyridoxamine 5'-phosphate oxidase superfamily)
MDEEIRRKIVTLLDQHRIMTIATLRADGWPQATTVGYANEGLMLYFLCAPDSQKAANLARDDRVSLTIDHDTPRVMEITGLSMAAPRGWKRRTCSAGSRPCRRTASFLA